MKKRTMLIMLILFAGTTLTYGQKQSNSPTSIFGFISDGLTTWVSDLETLVRDKIVEPKTRQRIYREFGYLANDLNRLKATKISINQKIKSSLDKNKRIKIDGEIVTELRRDVDSLSKRITEIEIQTHGKISENSQTLIANVNHLMHGKKSEYLDGIASTTMPSRANEVLLESQEAIDALDSMIVAIGRTRNELNKP